MTRTGTTRRQTARLLLVLWGLICLGNVVFRHSHRLANGRLVSHSHLYAGFTAKCPFPNHQHTQHELAWLDCIGNAPFDGFTADLTCPLSVSWLMPRLTYSYVETQGGQRFLDYFLRGPPNRVG
jgi:hypothetical protein